MVLGVVVGVVGTIPYVLAQAARANADSAQEGLNDDTTRDEYEEKQTEFDTAIRQYEFWGQLHNTIGLTAIAGGVGLTVVSVAVAGGGSAWLLLSGDEE